MAEPLSHRLAAFWAWAHGEIDESPVQDRDNGLLWSIGAMFLLMALVHLELEVRDAPLVRGFWRGGAFLGLSLAAVVWPAAWRAGWASRLGALACTALLLVPTALRVHPDLALREHAVLGIGLSLLGLGLVWLQGRRLGVVWADYGLTQGDWRWWTPRAAVLAALIVVGTVFAMWLSPELRDFYPWQRIARTDPRAFTEVQIAVFLDFLGWEYLHRGLLLFAFARRGDVRGAIWTQALVFFVLHTGKPTAELVLSLPGGVIAGYFAWRSRSFVPLWLLHGLQLASVNQVALWMRGGFA